MIQDKEQREVRSTVPTEIGKEQIKNRKKYEQSKKERTKIRIRIKNDKLGKRKRTLELGMRSIVLFLNFNYFD